MAQFLHITNVLTAAITPPVLVILENAFVTILHVTEER